MKSTEVRLATGHGTRDGTRETGRGTSMDKPFVSQMSKVSSLQIVPAKRDAYILQFEYSNNENMEYFKQQIDKKVGSMNHKTNVKGGMTDYGLFLEDSTFTKFLEKFFIPEIHKYQQLFPLGQNIQRKMNFNDAWGNKLEKGNQVVSHGHPSQWSSILYFCDSAPLETEVGTFETFKGKIITISGWMQHWVSPVDKERYSLVWNWNCRWDK